MKKDQKVVQRPVPDAYEFFWIPFSLEEGEQVGEEEEEESDVVRELLSKHSVWLGL